MGKIDVKIKKWGNSFGVIIPNEIVKFENIREGQIIRIDISTDKKTRGSDIFGKLKFKKPINEILDSVDRDFEPEIFS